MAEQFERTFKIAGCGQTRAGSYFVKDFDDQWYTTFSDSLGSIIKDLKKGDKVDMVYTKTEKNDRVYKNISGIERVIDKNDDMEPDFVTEPDSPETPPLRAHDHGKPDTGTQIATMNAYGTGFGFIGNCVRAGIIEDFDEAIDKGSSLSETILNRVLGK